MWAVLNGEVGQDMLESDKLSQNGIEGLAWYTGGSRNFYTTKKQIELWDKYEQKSLAKAQQEGCIITHLTDEQHNEFKDAVADFNKKWKKNQYRRNDL